MEYKLKNNIYRTEDRVIATKKAIILAEQQGIDIYESALDRLHYDAFLPSDRGTDHLANLISQLYYERYLLLKYYKRPSYLGYWDLNDIFNPHLLSIGNPYEIQDEIRQAIIHSFYEDDDTDINELVYDLTDLEIRHNNVEDIPRNELPSYQRLLSRR